MIALRFAGRWIGLGALVGVLAGVSSALFLWLLTGALGLFRDHPALISGLPLAGFAVSWLYRRFGGRASAGTALALEAIHTGSTQHDERIPLRMAPFVLGGTVIAHLFGASVGREGTAVQMGAALADAVRRVFRLDTADRRLIIMAGISGGFGAVFGTPVAGAVFGLEVHSAGRIRYDGLLPCVIAAVIGDWTAHVLGATHSVLPALAERELSLPLIGIVAAAGIAFGLAARLFIALGHAVKHGLSRFIAYPPLRPAVGGLIVIALTVVVGTTDYNGLSLPLIAESVSAEGSVSPFAWLLKLIFTGISVGSGFIGGEVTPLFGIGASLGHALGTLVGDPALLAAIGFAAVFAGASNTPIACTLMAVEVFGGGSVLYILIGVVMAYLVSGTTGLYSAQRIDTAKLPPERPPTYPT